VIIISFSLLQLTSALELHAAEGIDYGISGQTTFFFDIQKSRQALRDSVLREMEFSRSELISGN